MASFNKVIVMGNLTRDPEMRVTPAGLAICKFSIAINRKFKLQSGEEREEVTYVDVDAFGKQAEVIAKFFSKGKAILVEGRLKTDSWEDKTTKQKRSKLGVTLEGFSFADSGRGQGGGGDDGAPSGANYDDAAPPARPARSTPADKYPPPPGDQIDEDVPF